MVDDGSVTLADLLAVPALGLREVLAGRDAPVRWAHATELLDPAPYLRGGELVCTVGQALDSAAACAAFAAAVARAGAVGVCFGTGDVHDDVPPGLLQACRQHGLALVGAERGTPFMAITEHLAQRRVAGALAGERVGQLLDLLGERAVAAAALLPALVDAGLGRAPLVVTAWPAGGALSLADALAGVPHLIGATDDVTLCVTAADVTLCVTAADVALGAPAGVVGAPGDVAVEGSSGPAAGAGDLPRGTSSPVPWRDLGTAVRAARAGLAEALAARAAVALAASGEAATFAALLAAQPPERLAPFADRLLRPLLAADRRRGTGLVDTLRAYLACDGSLVEVARQRYLHVNSVRHRLGRIEQLTGTDVTTLAGAAAFAVALWAHDHAGRA